MPVDLNNLPPGLNEPEIIQTILDMRANAMQGNPVGGFAMSREEFVGSQVISIGPPMPVNLNNLPPGLNEPEIIQTILDMRARAMGDLPTDPPISLDVNHPLPGSEEPDVLGTSRPGKHLHSEKGHSKTDASYENDVTEPSLASSQSIHQRVGSVHPVPYPDSTRPS
jgi:hypothetical protein